MSSNKEPFDTGESLHESADLLVERLASIFRTLEAAAGGLEVELYHRASLTIRASRRAGASVAAIEQGRDDGMAVRTRSGAGCRAAFAASTGSDAEGALWALERCRQVTDEGRDPDETWPARATTPRVDREEAVNLPSPGDLTAWLAAASERLAEPGEARGRWGAPLETRVEVAATVETWAASRGLHASRVRTRAWAMARTRGLDADQPLPSPVMIARRRWEELPTDGWRTLLEDRLVTTSSDEPLPGGRVPVLFNPECSAQLVSALVGTLHTPGQENAFEVGPAWQLVDDPTDTDALYGSRFDDAGFMTRRTVLANGELATGRIAGKGHFRRPSFRDRPAARAFHLVVRARPGDAPPEGVLVTGVTLHPAAPGRWLLEVGGAMLDRGLPGAPLPRAYVAISPEELVRRCVAAVGPARPSHLGISTPALVFDGLSLQ